MKEYTPTLVVIALGDSVREVLKDLRQMRGLTPGEAEVVVAVTSLDRLELVPEGCAPLEIEHAIVAMREREKVVLVANGGTTELQAPLLLAAGMMPHVHVVNVQRDGVTVLRAGTGGLVEMIVACTKAIETLAEKRAQWLRDALSYAKLVHTNRWIPGCTDPEEIGRYERCQNDGEFHDPSLRVHDWRGDKADPKGMVELEEDRETSEFTLGGLRVIIHDSLMSTEREPMAVYFLDPIKR